MAFFKVINLMGKEEVVEFAGTIQQFVASRGGMGDGERVSETTAPAPVAKEEAAPKSKSKSKE